MIKGDIRFTDLGSGFRNRSVGDLFEHASSFLGSYRHPPIFLKCPFKDLRVFGSRYKGTGFDGIWFRFS